MHEGFEEHITPDSTKSGEVAPVTTGDITAQPREQATSALGSGALANSISPEEWMRKGLCTTVPPSTFFPSDGAGVHLAKKICAECPVKEVCLQYALEARIDHGIWGGESERERRRILKRRRAG